MFYRESGLDADGEALMRMVDQTMNDRKIAEAGGYTPPNNDPRKCEPSKPALPDHLGGFDLRLKYKEANPFDRCEAIGCRVKHECTALIREALGETNITNE